MLVCDVCRTPDPHDDFWGNEYLLGTRDLLCRGCFLVWYEEGVRTREKILQIRRQRGEV